MAQKKSVEDVWRQLKSSAAPRRPDAKRRDRNNQSSQNSAPPAGKGTGPPGGWDAQADACSAGSVERRSINVVGTGAGDVACAVAALQRNINCLSDPDRATRRRAIDELAGVLAGEGGGGPPAAPELLQALLCGPLLHPLIAMLSDPVEKCRERALHLLTVGASRMVDIAPLLPALMPAVARRMGYPPVLESSEEVRLALVHLVGGPVMERGGESLAGYLTEVTLLICRALQDQFHEVKKAGCTAVIRLCAVVTATQLAEHSEALVQAVLAGLSHQHSRVRTACLQALDALVVRGLPAGMVSQKVAPALQPQALDKVLGVRQSCFEMIAGWLGADREGVQEAECVDAYGASLLPLLVLGATDEDQDLAAQTLALIDSAGVAYCNQADSEETSRTGRQDAMEVDSASPAPGTSAHAETTEQYAKELLLLLGKPYTALPSAQTQRLVWHLLPDILPSMLQSLKEWTVTNRLANARGLHTLVALSGAGIEKHLDTLLPAICTAVGDEDAKIAGRLVSCVHLLGAHVPVASWMPLMLDQLSASRTSAAHLASTLVVLSSLLYSAGTLQHSISDDLLKKLAVGLGWREVQLCGSPAVKHQLTCVVANMLRLAGAQSGLVSREVCRTLLQLMGNGADGEARPVLLQLAVACGLEKIHEIVDRHAGDILHYISEDAADWTESSPNCQVFRALLSCCGPEALRTLMTAVVPIMNSVLGDHSRDPALRLAYLNLLTSLIEDEAVGPVLGGPAAGSTLTDLLLPPLVWRAGKTATAVRFAAITALASFLALRLVDGVALRERLDAGDMLPAVFQALEEDYYADVRHTACYVMEHIILITGGLLTDAHRRALYPELLKRLDDSSNRVRVAACGPLRAFVATMPPDYCSTNTGYLLAGMLIHMDDGEAGVREAVYSVVEGAAAKRPDVTEAEVMKVRERFRCRMYCDRALEACRRARGE
ncbi:unnamed protein product [Ostreobium quekettii]|uniref:Uncharacterized protein n=1 Tax=Ostreobium quekettii TaxID=121088 RepID=A0A8S1J530_9CHLO|nr:unnamed protein product [Ostreobium quekettii]